MSSGTKARLMRHARLLEGASQDVSAHVLGEFERISDCWFRV